MGGTFYSCDARDMRAALAGYTDLSKSTASIFTQSSVRRVHESMDSKKVEFREARDSEVHPKTYPIILALDVTGSMGSVPRQLIADGLPTLMGKVIQNGLPDAALLFLAIGDHECDRYPVQVAQFESGDAELDMWLTRTYLEGGGGGNSGESYPLAWEFAANRVVTDAWEKRKQKGLLITIGDEPFLKNFPASSFKEIYGDNAKHQGNQTAAQLLAAAQERFDVYHIFLEHGARRADDAWKQLLGHRLITTGDYTKIPEIIANIAVEHGSDESLFTSQSIQSKNESDKEVTESPVVPIL